MKKINLILAIISVFYINLNAQEINPEVISSSGDYFKQANGSMSWTIGEPMTETNTNGTTIIQGFHGLVSISVFELENMPKSFYATSFCNLHDLWVSEYSS